MPILNLNAIRRQGELIGTDVPDEVVARIAAHEGDPAAMRAEGIAIAAELCEAAARRRRAGAALLHAEPLQGDAARSSPPSNHRLSRAVGLRFGCAPSPSPATAPRTAVPDTAAVRLAAVHRRRSLAEALAGARVAPRAEVVDARAEATWWSRRSTSRSGRPTSEGQQPGFEARHTPDHRHRRPRRSPTSCSTALAYEVGDRLAGRGRRRSTVARPRRRDRGRRARRRSPTRAPRPSTSPRSPTRRSARSQAVAEGGARARCRRRRRAMAKADVGAPAGRDRRWPRLTVTWSLT